LEVANVLLVGERRDRLTSAQASHFLEMLEILPNLIDLPASLKTMGDIYTLAGTYQLSAYDTAYLELAKREGVVLATLNDSLSTAATKAGVSVF
jgi:predicted nucleic acid-binding protein